MKRRSLVHRVLTGVIFLALAACQSAALPGPAPGPAPEPPAEGGVPAELVGEWYTGSASSIGFYNPDTGSWASPSGNGLSYTFMAEGRYQEAFLEQVQLYGCYTGFFVFIEGVVRVQGASFTKSPGRGVFRFEDTCSPSLNEERELSREELADHAGQYSWRISADPADPGLRYLDVTLPDGSAYLTLRYDGPPGSY